MLNSGSERSRAPAPLKVAVFLPSLAGGGAERVTLAVCRGLVSQGFDVSLVVGTAAGELAGEVPDGVELTDLKASRALAATAALSRYLRRTRPDVVISAISHASIIAAFVVRVSLRRGRLIVVHHNTTSISTRRSVRRRDRLIPLLCAVAYRSADRILAVSHGVAVDLAESSHLPVQRIEVLPNPIEYERIRALTAVPTPDRSRYDDDATPLVLGVGRLEAQKGFDVLLRAAATAAVEYRLVILGDGPLRAELTALADELGIAARVEFAGFVSNPYPYFADATVFALSSRWEGLPTVLLEALAFRLRIVSTDCPSGPAEILRGVDGAELVPVDNVQALADAVDRAIAAGRLSDDRPDWHAYDFGPVMERWASVVREVAYAS